MKKNIKTKYKLYPYRKLGNHHTFYEIATSDEELIKQLTEDTDYCFFFDVKSKITRKQILIKAKFAPILLKNDLIRLKQTAISETVWKVFIDENKY